MKQRELRRQYRRLLNKLDIQPPLDVAALCRRMGELRGKPIRLVPYPIPAPGPFGMWVSTSKAEYILYQEETTELHQEHIILHELGHILAGHHSGELDDSSLTELDPATEPSALRKQYPDIGPDAVRRALRRTAYDTEQELEAETVATIILEWASILDDAAPQPSRYSTGGRMSSGLDERLGWR